MVSILPATATVIGVVVLRQMPTALELAGIALVVLAVALHREQPEPRRVTVAAQGMEVPSRP
jgi:inner membrane transporter RhtA